MTVNNVSNGHYDKHFRNKERDRFYHSTAWKKARKLALIRDCYLCQECLRQKRITKADMVHHIVEVKDDLTKALTLENLVSLCNPCHNKQDHGSKKSKNVQRKIKVKSFSPNEEMI